MRQDPPKPGQLRFYLVTTLEAWVCALQGIFRASPNPLQGPKFRSRDDYFKSLEPPRYLLFPSYYIS
jgi:hypothetical protein